MYHLQEMADSTFFSGLIDFLENVCEAREIETGYRAGAAKSEVVAWERHQICALPKDMNQFYLASNGVSLHWKYFYNGKVVHLGTIHVNSLKDLCPLHIEKESCSATQTSYMDLDTVAQAKVNNGAGWVPTFNGSCKIFVLDFSSVSGHICLVFNTAAEDNGYGIWLLDLSLSWHYICPTFGDFLRLAVLHLGLMQWPYAFTPFGLSPHFEKWFHMFVPKRLELDRQHVLSQSPRGTTILDLRSVKSSDDSMMMKTSSSLFRNHLDISKILCSSALKEKKQQSSVLPLISSRKTQPK